MAYRKVTPDEGKRLLKIKTLEKLTWQQMADILGVKEPTLRQISCGRLPLSKKMSQLVCDHFPKYSVEWLFNNNGNMYTDEYNDMIEETANNPYAGWTATQLSFMLEQKDKQISLMEKSLNDKEELIVALREQLLRLQSKKNIDSEFFIQKNTTRI